MNIAELGSLTSGKWTWDEVNNGIEFVSSYAADDERRSKDRQPRGSDTQRGRSKRSLRVLPRPVIKPTKNCSTVVLQDVKGFAMSLLSEVEPVDEEFDNVFDKPQIDDLLVLLLNYFHWFFEKRAMEANPDPSHIDVSMETRRRLESLSQKLEGMTKQLGRSYGLLVLGSGVPELHHMGAGRSRVSSMDRDRKLFELFYSFCVFVVWLTFKRQDYDIIKYEINRMFRSDSFNPSLSANRERDTENLTDAEYRRTLGKRPSKMELANQRSMAMISIVPLPREEASWLYDRNGTLSKGYKEKMVTEEKSLEELEQQYRNLRGISIKKNVGIIGMPLAHFNLQTLAINEDESSKNQNKSECDRTVDRAQESLDRLTQVTRASSRKTSASLNQRIKSTEAAAQVACN